MYRELKDLWQNHRKILRIPTLKDSESEYLYYILLRYLIYRFFGKDIKFLSTGTERSFPLNMAGFKDFYQTVGDTIAEEDLYLDFSDSIDIENLNTDTFKFSVHEGISNSCDNEEYLYPSMDELFYNSEFTDFIEDDNGFIISKEKIDDFLCALTCAEGIGVAPQSCVDIMLSDERKRLLSMDGEDKKYGDKLKEHDGFFYIPSDYISSENIIEQIYSDPAIAVVDFFPDIVKFVGKDEIRNTTNLCGSLNLFYEDVAWVETYFSDNRVLVGSMICANKSLGFFISHSANIIRELYNISDEIYDEIVFLKGAISEICPDGDMGNLCIYSNPCIDGVLCNGILYTFNIFESNSGYPEGGWNNEANIKEPNLEVLAIYYMADELYRAIINKVPLQTG